MELGSKKPNAFHKLKDALVRGIGMEMMPLLEFYASRQVSFCKGDALY
jgi:hypothetical protein